MCNLVTHNNPRNLIHAICFLVGDEANTQGMELVAKEVCMKRDM